MSATALIEAAGGDKVSAANPVIEKIIQTAVQVGTDLTEDEINIVISACQSVASDIEDGDSISVIWNKVVKKLGDDEEKWIRKLGSDVLNFLANALTFVKGLFGL